jgi:nucleotide-binding universal stress UspA family protein
MTELPATSMIDGMDAPFIVGIDGSPAAAAALQVTKCLATGVGTSVVVTHAFAPGHDIADARAASDELLAQVSDPDVRHRSIAAHSPVDGLRDVARYEGAALLAVGRTHHGAVGRALDSVPGQLIHDAPCGVLVVPVDARTAIASIGVAFDGGDESRVALSVALDLARQLDARIVLLGVGQTPPYLGTEVVASRRTLDRELIDMHDQMQQAVAAAGDGAVEYRTLDGPVAPTLVHACNEGIDLLVTGSRAQGPIATVFAGSVSRHLAHHAPCPVLIVPRGVTGLRGTGRDTVSAA